MEAAKHDALGASLMVVVLQAVPSEAPVRLSRAA
jgi:hypothetical protein